MVNGKNELEAQADAVAWAVDKLRQRGVHGSALVDAEQTLRLLNRLALLMQEHHQDEAATEELVADLLTILRLPVSS